MIFTLNAIQVIQVQENEMGGVCGTYWGKREMHTGIWWGNLTERFPIGRLGRRWEDDIKMDLKSRMGEHRLD